MEFGFEAEKRTVIAALLVLVAGGAAGFYAGGFFDGPTGAAVRDALELSTGSELEVLTVRDRGSLDQVILTDGSEVVQAWVTEDRRYLIRAVRGDEVLQGFTPLANFTRQLEATDRFVSCLGQHNATFYGVAGANTSFAQYTRSTRLQLQVLGGQQALRLFGGLGPRQIRPLVLDYNRTRGIVWQINGRLRGGIHTVDMLEQRTPCTYDASPASTGGS